MMESYKEYNIVLISFKDQKSLYDLVHNSHSYRTITSPKNFLIF